MIWSENIYRFHRDLVHFALLISFRFLAVVVILLFVDSFLLLRFLDLLVASYPIMTIIIITVCP